MDRPDEWFSADQVKPRELAVNKRCLECATGGMRHPAHAGRRCGAPITGVGRCGCGSQVDVDEG